MKIDSKILKHYWYKIFPIKLIAGIMENEINSFKKLTQFSLFLPYKVVNTESLSDSLSK